jgi:hypothetical protein
MNIITIEQGLKDFIAGIVERNPNIEGWMLWESDFGSRDMQDPVFYRTVDEMYKSMEESGKDYDRDLTLTDCGWADSTVMVKTLEDWGPEFIISAVIYINPEPSAIKQWVVTNIDMTERCIQDSIETRGPYGTLELAQQAALSWAAEHGEYNRCQYKLVNPELVCDEDDMTEAFVIQEFPNLG